MEARTNVYCWTPLDLTDFATASLSTMSEQTKTCSQTNNKDIKTIWAPRALTNPPLFCCFDEEFFLKIPLPPQPDIAVGNRSHPHQDKIKSSPPPSSWVDRLLVIDHILTKTSVITQSCRCTQGARVHPTSRAWNKYFFRVEYVFSLKRLCFFVCKEYAFPQEICLLCAVIRLFSAENVSCVRLVTKLQSSAPQTRVEISTNCTRAFAYFNTHFALHRWFQRSLPTQS